VCPNNASKYMCSTQERLASNTIHYLCIAFIWPLPLYNKNWIFADKCASFAMSCQEESSILVWVLTHIQNSNLNLQNHIVGTSKERSCRQLGKVVCVCVSVAPMRWGSWSMEEDASMIEQAEKKVWYKESGVWSVTFKEWLS
jgi:hypothetical protein